MRAAIAGSNGTRAAPGRSSSRFAPCPIWKQLNLFDPWPIREGVDAIVCRNVLVYFDTEHRQRLIRGFARIQRPGEHLFIGHSETLRDPGGSYERVGNTVFRRR